MSRNLRIFSFSAVIFATVGLMNDATVMYVLAGVCAAVILVAFLLSQLALTRLQVEMHPPARRSVAGAAIRPALTVTSVGSITVGAIVELRATNVTVPGVEVAHRVLLPPLPPSATVEVGVELTPPTRGRYRLGPAMLVDSDSLGMFQSRSARGEAFDLIVFPRTYDVPRVGAWETGFGRMFSRGRDARRDRGEFRGIREHTPGDDLRHVHWKVTAHVGELAVKEYEPIRHDVISIHLDLGADAHYGAGATSTLETAVSAAASLARAGLAEQRSVAVNGRGLPPSVARPGVGQAHLQRIMVALAEAQPSQELFMASLPAQLRQVPRGASVFIITTGAEAGLVQAVSGVRSGAGSVALLIVEGDLQGAPQRFAERPRALMHAARAAGMAVGLLRSPGSLKEALTAGGGPAVDRAGVA